MALFYGKEYEAKELRRRVGDMSQLACAEPFELTEGNQRGTRGVRLQNGTGLAVTVLPDRGMSLTDVLFEGIPVAFKTAVGSMHPSFFSDKGLDWLRAWPGGFLTPCGLTYVGAPCRDEGEALGIHGRITGIPARNVTSGGQWIDDSTYEVHAAGTMRETAVFAENMVMTRRVSMRIGSPCFSIEDRFVNEGFEASPFMVLQHVNLGFPLVDDGSRMILSETETEPRDEVAASGLNECREFGAPRAGFEEQVFYHTPKGDADGRVTAGVYNPGFNGGEGLAVALSYSVHDYPTLVEWKMMGEGTYVVGVEPANCKVGGRAAAREAGDLQFLEPGETRSFRIDVQALRGEKAAAMMS